MAEFTTAVAEAPRSYVSGDSGILGPQKTLGPREVIVETDPDLLWVEDGGWDEERCRLAEERLKEQGKGGGVPEHWYKEYTNKASKHWSLFYKRNGDRFFKDRHYLHAEFPEVLETDTLLEVGCGVGNCVIPLLELNHRLRAHAIDFATSAIDILKEKAVERLECAVCDVVNDELCVAGVGPESMELVMCMFVLSAIAPEHQQAVVQKLADCLRPGGKLLFRDYGKYDEAQLRFKKNSKLKESFYVRQDGTCSYFFELQEVIELMGAVGLTPVDGRCEYVRRQMANRSTKQARSRVWIQGVWAKAAKSERSERASALGLQRGDEAGGKTELQA